MKYILITAYTALNLGDDLFLKILLDRYPSHKFILFSSNNEYSILLSNYNNVQIEYYNKFERFLLRGLTEFNLLFSIRAPRLVGYVHKVLLKNKYKNKCDAYLEIGGSIFIQKDKSLSVKEYKNRSISEIFKNKPMFILGANFGPSINEEFVNFYHDLFSRFSDVCFREKKSYDLFADIKQVRYESDIVYALKIPVVLKEKESLGISLIDLSKRTELNIYASNYISTIVALVTKAIEVNKKVYLFSFCKSEGDEDAINAIREKLPSSFREKVQEICYDGNIDSFLESYLKVEAMFTSRFHAMILSLIANQNVYPLIYSLKMTNALQDIGFKGMFSYIKDMKIEIADEMLHEIYKNSHKLTNEAISAEEQFIKLDSFLNNG